MRNGPPRCHGARSSRSRRVRAEAAPERQPRTPQSLGTQHTNAQAPIRRVQHAQKVDIRVGTGGEGSFFTRVVICRFAALLEPLRPLDHAHFCHALVSIHHLQFSKDFLGFFRQISLKTGSQLHFTCNVSYSFSRRHQKSYFRKTLTKHKPNVLSTSNFVWN